MYIILVVHGIQGKIIILKAGETAVVKCPPSNEDVFSITKFEKKEQKKKINKPMEDK